MRSRPRIGHARRSRMPGHASLSGMPLIDEGKKAPAFTGIARTTYLIDPGGKVARRWDNVKVDGHAEEVLEAVALGLKK